MPSIELGTKPQRSRLGRHASNAAPLAGMKPQSPLMGAVTGQQASKPINWSPAFNATASLGQPATSPLAAAVTGQGQQPGFQPRQQPNAPAVLPPPPKFPEKRTIDPADVGSPTPGGIYADRLKAGAPLMTNDQAVDFHDQHVDPILGTRFMPKTTVGGAWGQRPSAEGQAQQAAGPAGQYNSPRLSLSDVMNRRDPTSDAAAGKAVTAKLMENPNGRWFGGAQINPNQEQYPGRSTFIDPARPAHSAEDQAESRSRFAAAAGRAVARDPSLSISSTGALQGTMNPAFAPPNAEQMAANREAYQARRATTQADRQSKVAENAGQRQDARRVRMGDLNTEERLAMADPRGAMMAKVEQGRADGNAAELKQQGELARQEMDLRRALGMGNIDVARAGNEARNRAGQQEVAGNVLGAIPQLVDSGALTPEQGQQAAAQAMQQLQGGPPTLQQAVSGQAQKTFESLPPIQRQELLATPPEGRRDYIVGKLGVTDPDQIEAIMQAASGNQTVTPFAPEGYGLGSAIQDSLGFGPRMTQDRAEGGLGIPWGLSPAGAVGSWLFDAVRGRKKRN